MREDGMLQVCSPFNSQNPTCAHLIASDAGRNSLIVWLGIHRRGGGTRELVPMVHLPFHVEKKPAGK